ncbi:uncharacterized protein PAC_14737 [Phialocephala subalpina]|uniref:Transcription factor domain-containing protein n=1 Tax=Phialocephala subalpina TaxID=576137 RepID=A0A1L7XIJ3_9HELO|nr:uncharacterized protein PAC_14737 [Phialocephala subalpina]
MELPRKQHHIQTGTAVGKNVQGGVEQSPSDYSTPLFSVSEAQEAIQKEIESAPNLSDRRRAVFNAAINSLKQGLDASEGESKLSYGSLECSSDALHSPAIPPPELIHCILQPRPYADSEPWALNCFMPLVSKKTFVRMYHQLYETKDGDYDVPSLLIVTTNTYSYLTDVTMPDTNESGLEKIMTMQVAAYLATARAAIAQLSLLAAPSLINLQALCHGAIVSQEAGDLGSAWSLTQAGSTMCLRLDLHRNQNQFTRPDTAFLLLVPRSCLPFAPQDFKGRHTFRCIKIHTSESWKKYADFESSNGRNDKGLAMSLGRSSQFKDSEIEVDLLKRPDPENSLKRQVSRSRTFSLLFIWRLLNVPVFLSGIVSDLQSRHTHREPHDIDIILSLLLHRLDGIWQNIRIVSGRSTQRFEGWLLITKQAQTEAEKTPRVMRVDPDLEWLMVDFTFYSLKAALLTAPALSHESRARYKNAALEAARASLNELQKARHFAYMEDHPVELLKSVSHWTILYFPFTSFFILFCNVATTNFMPDYNVMREFVTHLSELRETSQAMAKLYNLCQAFCTLAATLLSTPESTSKRLSISEGMDNNNGTPARKRPRRACTEKMALIPVENTINILNPVSFNATTAEAAIMVDGMAPNMADNFGPEMSLPVSDINYDPIPYVDNDSSLWQLLDTQPRLQWLDTDLSAFDNVWGDPNLYQDILPGYQGL